MNTFLTYLAVAALFALVLAPVAFGAARERRITRQLRDAGRGQAPPTEAESAARPGRATRRLPARSWAKA
ncbi:hypothetical protein [Streptomyces sp. NPDC048142]|uniref:hypothetical protein n=1 Tax=Streptomyces sp. NPDC048142 TaxID=3365501 RepID=UPI003711D57D